MMDSISRMVPGVLSNQESGETESFAGNLLEYPQYSRPEEWHGKKVPEVLMSGHHANIEKWRREQSIIRTARRRPDLLKKADLTNKEWNFVRQLKKQWKEEESKDNINDIEMYKGRDLWVPREEAQELDEDEYYIGDLIGMEVVLEDNTHFGTLKDVMETGANDVYVVELPDHQEVLLPAIRECILDVDLEENVMTVHLMKGLL